MVTRNRKPIRAGQGMLAALFSAGLFGMSAPLAKLLLGKMSSLVLAGLLYLGSGVGLFLLGVLIQERGLLDESRLRRADLPLLAGTVLCGGVIAPVLLMYGLSATTGSAASLLLNMEGVFTLLIAALLFREPVGLRIGSAAALTSAAGVLLSFTSGSGGTSLNPASLLIAAACLLWALDNNLMRRLSHRSPYVLARTKGLVAGATSLSLALAAGEPLPSFSLIAGTLLLGAFSYGASLVLFIYALRSLGTSRTIACFGTAPFLGAAVSLLLFRDQVTFHFIAALFLMLGGTALVVRESHEHEHEHDAVLHEHRHTHDEHHDHHHAEGCDGPHCHEHEHAFLEHSHAHVPDLHHYHRH